MSLLLKIWITLFAGAALLLAGCAAPSSYMGISFKPNAAAVDLQLLAERAMAGDKHAQLELGLRYEEGIGVPINLKVAMRLYALAARDSGGVAWVYTPPVQLGQSGRVLPMNKGVKQNGLEQARQRLAALEERGR